MSQRSRVVNLYKTLLHLGKDYPQGFEFFRTRLHRVFLKNKDETDPEKIEKMISHGNYIVKELEALYMLKKYRTLKRRYYNEQQ
ncbi:electron transfer flavoprotein regulatory factor 1 [Atheta coriaria]|uniref:electron transfer flavoprotein regulatory factor 1 n=1 Tax=Dalotia coriaria TaxID=877792 RepID=UPI0031F35495